MVAPVVIVDRGVGLPEGFVCGADGVWDLGPAVCTDCVGLDPVVSAIVCFGLMPDGPVDALDPELSSGPSRCLNSWN